MGYSLFMDTSNFKPYDFGLTFLIIKEIEANRLKNEEYLDAITLKAGDLASAVNDSPKAKEIYDNYINRINTVVDRFDSGASGVNKEIGQLRRLYGTLIRQLERANEARVKAAEYLRALNKNNDYLHEELGTLDDWLENPNRDVRGYSGTLLTNEVGALTKAASNDIVKMVNAGHLTPYTLLFLKQRGFSSNDVNRTIAEVQQGGIENVTDPVMKNILTSAMNASGIYNWADEATKRNAENIAARGLYQGVGQSDITTAKDDYALENLKYQFEEKKAEAAQLRALELLKAKSDLEYMNSLGGTDFRSYLDEKDEKGKTKYLKLKESVESLIDEDGNLKQEYRTRVGRVNDPIAIYEAYQKYALDNAKYSYSPTRSYESSRGLVQKNAKTLDYEGAMNYIRNTYGVLKVITSEQYQALKDLGYDNFSAMNHGGYSGFNMSDYADRLNNLATRNKVSIAKGDKITEALLNEVDSYIDLPNLKGVVKVVENGKITDSDATGTFKALDSELKKHVRFGIDLGNEKVIAFTPIGTIAIQPEAFGGKFMLYWLLALNSTDPRLPGKYYIMDSNKSNKEKSEDLYKLQESLLQTLMKLTGNNVHKVSSQTTSND